MATIRIIVFTFHNVSINTTTGAAQLETMITYLHSTMFLLILVGSFVRRGIAGDLHSTMFLLIQRYGVAKATVTKIYIPQCFY